MEENNNVEVLEEQKEVQQEVKVDTPKKKNQVVIFILILVLMCGCLVGGYFINELGLLSFNKDKDVKEEKKETKKEEKEENSVTFTDSELEKYIGYISPVSYGPSAKIYDVDSVSVNSLSSREKIEYVGNHVYDKKTDSADYQYSIISEADVKSVVEEIYGPKTYERTTFNLGCGDYTINENEGKYYSKNGCGGTTATSVANVVIDYKATDKKLEITTAYAIHDQETKKIYKDYNKNNPIDDYDVKDYSSFDSYFKDYVKTNKDKLNHIVYTFESKDGRNYYFTGFTNNK